MHYTCEIQKIILTHFSAKHPGFGLGVDLDQDGRRADQQHHQIGDAQVHQENVGAVAHILRLEYHNRHHHVTDDTQTHDNDTEHYGGRPDVAGEDGRTVVGDVGRVRVIVQQIGRGGVEEIGGGGVRVQEQGGRIERRRCRC